MAQKFTTYSKIGGLPLPITEIDDATARCELGTMFETVDDDYGIKRYKYVKFNAAGAANAVYVFSDVYQREVTSTVSGNRNRPAGVGIGTVTSGNYGLVQCYGNATVDTNGDDDIADDDTIIVSSTNAKCDSVAAGTASTYRPLGIAVAADSDSANTVAVFLNCI